MFFFRLVDINEYMAGTINRVKKVDTNIPPTTATPMAIRPWAPSPVAYTNGTKPRMVDTLVIKIGRRRWVRQTKSRLLPLIGELYDQDTVLRHQTNQHNDTDLAEYIHRDTRITHEH